MKAPLLVLIKSSVSGGELTTVQNALGLTGGFTTLGGKQVWAIPMTDPSRIYKHETTYASLDSAGFWSHIIMADHTESRSQVLALAASHTSQTGTVAGSTSPVTINGDANGVTENQVFDCRTMNQGMVIEDSPGYRFRNNYLFSPIGNLGGATDMPQVVFARSPGFVCSNNYIAGGRGTAGIAGLGGGGIMRGNICGWDNRMTGEGLGFYCGNPEQFEDTLSYDPAAAALQSDWDANAGRVRWKPLTQLTGPVGSAINCAMVYHLGGGVINIDFDAAYQAQAGGAYALVCPHIPASLRIWMVKWDGGWAYATYRSGPLNGGPIVLDVFNSSGAYINIPEGPLAWFCYLPQWFVGPSLIEDNWLYGNPASKPPLSGITSYGVHGQVIRRNIVTGFGDRNIGIEWCKGFRVEQNICSGAGGTDMEPVTFMGMNGIVANNIAGGMHIGPHDRPCINVKVESPIGAKAIVFTNTGGTWLGGAGAQNDLNCRFISETFIDKVEQLFNVSAISTAAWPANFVPDSDPEAVP